MNILEVQNLTVRFGNQIILNKLNFVVEDKEIVAVIGPNGSGKTTLIKAILGLLPYTGHIRLFGQKPTEVLSEVGYVPQRFNFDRTFPITVQEFLGLFLKKSPDVVHSVERIEEILDDIGMISHRHKMLGALSGGELQRALIAAAIIHRPKMLFLDEATSGIDIEGVKDFYSVIRQLRDHRGMTIMMVSHEVSMVYNFADTVICLNRDLICRGTPKAALTAETLKRLYGDFVSLRAHQHND